MTKVKSRKESSVEDLLRDLMIIQLGLAGIAQEKIREIVAVDMNRVSRIVQHLKKVDK